jgi:hypothetical protein
MAERWAVYARGPHRLDAWRALRRGTEGACRAAYRRRHARLVAGHLMLVDPSGRPLLSAYRPPR